MKCCECGCGELAPISYRTQRSFGWVKGEPKRFILGHRARLYFRESNPAWKGGVILRNGYIRHYIPEHPRSISGYVKKGVLIAENVLGRYLKGDETVHHIDKNKTNDANNNLLVCHGWYHSFLHSCGSNNSRYGVKLSEETKHRISKSQKRRLYNAV